MWLGYLLCAVPTSGADEGLRGADRTVEIGRVGNCELLKSWSSGE